MRCPKHAQRRLYVTNDKEHGLRATGVIIVGYCPDTLDYFQCLYETAKESFPKLKSSAVTCSKVTNSPSIKGFTIILFDATAYVKDADFSAKDRHDLPLPYLGKDSAEWSVYNFGIDFNY